MDTHKLGLQAQQLTNKRRLMILDLLYGVNNHTLNNHILKCALINLDEPVCSRWLLEDAAWLQGEGLALVQDIGPGMFLLELTSFGSQLVEYDNRPKLVPDAHRMLEVMHES